MRYRLSSILWGVAFIVAGIGFAGNVLGLWNFSLFFDGWWTLFIIVPCVISMIQNRPNAGNIIGVCVGIMLLLSAQNVFSSRVMWGMMFPVVLVVIGINFLVRSNRNQYRGNTYQGNSYQDDTYQGGYRGGPKSSAGKAEGFDGSQQGQQAGQGGYSGQGSYTGQSAYTEDTGKSGSYQPHMEAGVPQFSTVFNGRKISYNNEVLQGAVLHTVFGGMDLDIRNAIIDQDVLIKVNSIFGGIDILAPDDVLIMVKDQSFCGGVSNKKSPPYGTPRAVVYIDAQCVFGGVDVK
ncbi:cell wall-active antibiotics response protein [Lachnospiraceae bacterium ASD3451]|uniref:LiaF transmembrane domain-containing protein n=1 Tax=Diplocloster agilis TaxID=2850323 RepID=UPI001D76CEFC|nr:LiaF domain-containing protein [Diplocloster agilis]MBU9742538.1 cell wall-active antibiotics response protein [Diplocloster agilis]